MSRGGDDESDGTSRAFIRSSRDTQILAPRDKDASENWCNRNETSVASNCAGRHLAAGGGIAAKISGGEAIEVFPLSRRAVQDFFGVPCSANRSGDPIVAEKRPNYYAKNYPELQAWIEIAHRPLIEVNDAARR